MWWRYALIALLCGCPTLGRGAPLRVAVAPIERVNLPAAEATRLQRLLVEALRGSLGVEVTRVATDVAIPCELRETDCLERLQRTLDSARLAALRAGRLGETTVIRLTVYDLDHRTRLGTWQEVLQERATERDERLALERMVAGFAPPGEAPAPWYARWWVWGAVGAVVAGGVTAAVLLSRDSGPGPDHTLVPP